jgi:hypothetical protein
MTVEFDVPATMRDGIALQANVYRPDGPGPYPVLLCRTPYGKDFAIGGNGIDVAQATMRGYIVAIQDTRGRFNSEGDWKPMVNEAEDGADSVAWAAALPGSDGRVGMYGGSYFGFTQWAAASQKPPALRAIAPNVTWENPFDGTLFRGGALELGLMASWHMHVDLPDLMRRHRGDPAALGRAVHQLVADYDALAATGFAELPLAEFPPLQRNGVGASFIEMMQKPLQFTDPTSAATSVHTWNDQVTVPSFNLGGWYDIFLAGTIANYQAARDAGRSTQLLIGPWIHGAAENPVGEVNFGIAGTGGFLDLLTDLGSQQLDWFDRHVKESPAAVAWELPVLIFVMGINKWRYEADWPLQRAETVPFYLSGDGELRDGPGDGADEFDYNPADPTPTLGGALLLVPEFRAGAYDQRRIESRPDVLTYTTPVLTEDLEVTGPISVRLWASTSAPDTDFVARLCDVFPDGRSINLTDGIIRGRHQVGAALEPGRPYEFVIDLWAASNVFRAGHRIRLDIASSSFPRWDRNPNTGHAFGADTELAVAHQRIWHDAEHPSRVLLPVVRD